MTPNQSQIEMMKTNREAFCFWPGELQQWALDNEKHFWVAKTYLKPNGSFDGTRAYQLDSDFELPKPERWYFKNQSYLLEKAHGDGRVFEAAGWIEVPTVDLEYVKKCLKRKDIEDFEYRTPEVGETYISLLTGGLCGCKRGEIPPPRFVRKPKPERWWYCNANKQLYSNLADQFDNSGNGCCVEVPAEDLEYVRANINREDIGEFEYRVPKKGDWYIIPSGFIAKHYGGHKACFFVRKPTPAPKSGWREFEICRNSDGETVVIDYPRNRGYTLSGVWTDALNRGLSPQFSCAERPNDWSQVPVFIANGQPAMPVKMRIWEGGAE